MTDREKEYFSDMYDKHAKAMYGICLIYLKNKEDAEEAVADSFIRIMESTPQFESDQHARAYLIKVCINICKDLLKSAWRRHVVHDEDVLMYVIAEEDQSILSEVLELPSKYRIVIYMHYYCGYTAQEIADIMRISQSAVLARLSRGRKKLKVILTEGGFSHV